LIEEKQPRKEGRGYLKKDEGKTKSGNPSTDSVNHLIKFIHRLDDPLSEGNV
jgi:hypothetical protein